MAQAIIGALRAELSAGIAKFAEDMGKAGDSVNNFGKRFRRVGGNISSFGRDLSMRVSAPIVAFGGFALKAAGDFEQGMNRVQAVSGATGEDLESLSELAKEMGSTTQFSASEAADAMGFLAMAGFEVNEIVGALPGTLELAAAAQMDLATSADIVSNVLSGYGLEVAELGRVNDVLAKTMTSANTDLQQLGEAMKMAGPVASAAGIRFEEASAAIGLMGNAGIQASMAGTSLRGAISRILSPTAKAAQLMEEAGLSFTDAQGRLLPLADIIEQLEPHAENAGMFMELFGQRAGPAMAAMVSQGSQSLRDLTTELDNAGGTASSVAEAQMQGFNGALRELKSAFEGLQLAIADSGLLETMTNLIKRLSDWTRNLSETNPEMLRMGTVVAVAAAALGPLVFAIGATISGLGGIISAMGLVMKAGPAFAGMAKLIGLAVATMGGPITIAITAVAALAGAFLMYRDEIIGYVSQLIESIDNALGGRLVSTIEAAQAVVQFFVDQFKLLFTGIGQVLTGDFSGALQTFSEMWSNIWGAAVNIVGNAVGEITGWLKGRLGAVMDWVGNKLESMKEGFKSLYHAVVGGSYVPDMVDGIIAEMERLNDGFVKPADDMTTAVGESFNELGQTVSGIFDEILQTGKVSGDSLKNLVGGVFGQMMGIGNVFNPSGGQSLGGSITGMLNGMLGGVFGGGLATGGLAMAGRPYLVGERGPELFRPHITGTVDPNASGGGGVTQVFNVTTPDANSFRRSERQILSGARRRLSTG